MLGHRPTPGALAIVCLVAFFLAAAFLTSRTGPSEPGPEARPPSGDATSQATSRPTSVREPAPLRAASAPPPADPALVEETSVPAAEEEPEPVRRYRELTRYPSSTRRITKDSFDLLNPGARHERRMPVPDEENNPDHAWQVRFTADRYFVRDTEPTLLSLELWHEGRPRLPTAVEMIAEPIGDGATGGAIPLAVATTVGGVQSTFVPNDYWPSLVGQIRVTAVFAADGLPQQAGSLDFYFTGADRIPARFTGEFADRPLRGDLVVEVGVEVDKPGRYRVEGNLADATGRPFGWARFDGDLADGPQRLPLVFYGLVFHDAGAVAPFTLQQVRGYRARPGDVPHREDMATFSGDYRTTSSYSPEDFRTKENDSPRRRRMIEMYQDALDRGVRLTTPEYVGVEN